VFVLSYIWSRVWESIEYSGTSCGDYHSIPWRLTTLIRRKILDSAVDAVLQDDFINSNEGSLKELKRCYKMILWFLNIGTRTIKRGAMAKVKIVESSNLQAFSISSKTETMSRTNTGNMTFYFHHKKLFLCHRMTFVTLWWWKNKCLRMCVTRYLLWCSN
jgi:hypothetical protein